MSSICLGLLTSRLSTYYQQSFAGNTTTRSDTDTQILDRLVAAPCEVLVIHPDTPISDGQVAAYPELCTSSDDNLDEDLMLRQLV